MKGKHLLLVAGLALGLAATGAQAQQGATNSGKPAQAASAQQSKVSIPKAQLQAFVDVQQDIRQVRGKYLGKIKAASSKKQKRSIQIKAEREMVKAIKKKGLSVKEYNKIARAYQSNAKIRKKINSMAKM